MTVEEVMDIAFSEMRTSVTITPSDHERLIIFKQSVHQIDFRAIYTKYNSSQPTLFLSNKPIHID